MSEERLQEIKDSIEFQYTLAKAKGHDNALLFTDEEQELVEEIERLNNIIEKTESMLKRLMEEQEYCYKKYPENWKERTSVSNTWLTSRDCYWSALKYLKKLKGIDKE